MLDGNMSYKIRYGIGSKIGVGCRSIGILYGFLGEVLLFKEYWSRGLRNVRE